MHWIPLRRDDPKPRRAVDYGLLKRPEDLYQVTHALAHTYARTEIIQKYSVVLTGKAL
jgi:hypothetical protein